MKYRKKPVVIEAIVFDGDNSGEVMAFTKIYMADIECRNGVNRFKIPTLEGDMWADPGDYIIKDVKGEFYPCKPDIFEMSYEGVIWDDNTEQYEIALRK